ncbi:MAG: hypothetical protein ACOC1U_10935, partial [Spirochaetota bacterium]
MTTGLDTERASGQALLFTRITGVPCVVLDRTGRVVYPPPASYPCALCREVAGEPVDAERSSVPHL